MTYCVCSLVPSMGQHMARISSKIFQHLLPQEINSKRGLDNKRGEIDWLIKLARRRVQSVVVNKSSEDLLGIVADDSGMEQQMQQLFSRWGSRRTTSLATPFLLHSIN